MPASNFENAAQHAQGKGSSRKAGVQNPRTDIGTLLLHWTAAIACLITLFTGLRLAADAEGSVIIRFFSPILPQGEIWTWHVFAGLALFFSSSAYIVYLLRSGLKRRVALGKVRALAMPAARRAKWGAVNVLLHWALYGLLVLMTATGIALYLGYGGWVVTVHSTTAVVTLFYIVAHVIGHYGYGGWLQVLRVFKPAALVPSASTRSRPLLIAAIVGAVVAGGLTAFDWQSRDTLVVRAVSQAPTLDGVLDETLWRTVPRVSVLTQQGSNLGGPGESTVEIRAVKDAEHIYFAFRWRDPTRSLKRLPIIKREDGWHLLHNAADIADETAYYEDKFAALFTRTATFGGGGTTHMGTKPLGDQPGALNDRGLHYTTDGAMADMWQWKASRGGHLGYVDDMHIGPPKPASADQIKGGARYSAGYDSDPGKAFYVYNYLPEAPGGFRGPVKLRRLPKDWQATQAKLGRIDLDVNVGDDEGTQWWMFESESAPYSAELDRTIPVGTVLPGVLIMGTYEGDRADVRGEAKWKDGFWTLEVKRSLKPTSQYDTAFDGDLYLWVSVFDHNQTRHTRHMRPVKLSFQ